MFLLAHKARMLTLMPVQKLTDIMTRILILGKEKDASYRCDTAGTVSLETSPKQTFMVIVSEYSLVEKKGETSVFC